MDIPMDRAPVQFRHAAARVVGVQQAAGRAATVSRIVASKSPHGWHYAATISTRNQYGTPSRPETVELHCVEGPRPLTRSERFAMVERHSRRRSTLRTSTTSRRAAAMDLDYIRSRIAHHERMRSPSVMVDTTPRRQQTARTGGLRRDYTPRLDVGLRGKAEYVTRDMHDRRFVLWGSCEGSKPDMRLAHTEEEFDALFRQARTAR